MSTQPHAPGFHALVCPQAAAPAQGARPQIKQEPLEGAGESEAAAPPVAKQRPSAAQRRRQRPRYYSSESSDEDGEDQEESEEEDDAVRLSSLHCLCTVASTSSLLACKGQKHRRPLHDLDTCYMLV